MRVNKTAPGWSYSYVKEIKVKDVIIIGGGASGIMAAIVAARRGAKVCILERLDRIGKKILVTGNVRCNITNINIQSKFLKS